MGLTAEPLVDAVQAGHEEAARCTTNDVITRAGFLRWATTLRRLGDVYVPQGWSRERPDGFEVLVNASKTIRISVAPGSLATGTDMMPTTRIERGPLTGQAVVGNRDQLRLGGDVHPQFRDDPAPGTQTWLLLHCVDEDEEEIRLELSLPVEFTRTPRSERGYVTRFEPRIVLPSISLAPPPEIEDQVDEEIDVPVAPRR